ncbi:MAG: inositol monophosphatase family protein [Planctomycetota bacterium]
MLSETAITELAETAKRAALAGGAALMDWRGRFSAREKGPSDFVTDADLASQAAVEQVIRAEHPDHAFVGEEDAAFDRPDDDQLCWVCDPLDGTTNYLHGFPCFAVSVGVTLGGELLAGAVFDPMSGEHFWAGRGRGAWLNDEPIRTSATQQLSDALVALSLPASVQPDSPDLVDLMTLIGRCQAIRRTGSAALNLAYVACGRLDVHWARQIKPWDVAAGVLLVREAGGVVSSASGGEFDLWRADFQAAATEPLHAEMAAVLARNAAASDRS